MEKKKKKKTNKKTNKNRTKQRKGEKSRKELPFNKRIPKRKPPESMQIKYLYMKGKVKTHSPNSNTFTVCDLKEKTLLEIKKLKKRPEKKKTRKKKDQNSFYKFKHKYEL